jgi:hypothetical protein
VRFSVNREGDNGSGNAWGGDRGVRCLVEGSEEAGEAGHVRWIVENEWWMMAGEGRAMEAALQKEYPVSLGFCFVVLSRAVSCCPVTRIDYFMGLLH